MVLSRLKDAPGSRYAFALTHTFLTQLPQALSNTILPSAISAVADTVVGRTTNSLTTLRGRTGLDEFDEEEEEDEDEGYEDDELEDDLDEASYQQQTISMRLHQQHDPRVSQQLSNEFGTIALASPTMSSASTSDCGNGSLSATESSAPSLSSPPIAHGHHGAVSISSAGASELLAASAYYNYSTTASQVLSASLPSFIPSMVAPIVCVFSYPTPPNSKTNSPNQLTPSSPSLLIPPQSQSNDNIKGKGVDNGSAPGHFLQAEMEDGDLQAGGIKANPAIAEVKSTAWTTAEREALFLAAARFKFQGQWSKIRQMMGLHRTDKEIEDEYQRLYGENDDDDDVEVEVEEEEEEQMRYGQGQGQVQSQIHDEEMTQCNVDDNDLVPIKQESEEDGDADDEAEATVFMRFGGGACSQRLPVSDATMSSKLMDISSLPATASRRRHSHHHHHHHRLERHHHHRRYDDKSILRGLNEKPLRIVKKEFMVDKRFTLEEIPVRL
ncbi:hypothetical protein BGZ58_004859 [Dissophora ornata]|nr:hypothetical protein BGZ58_004859 [Dissophora ornata]